MHYNFPASHLKFPENFLNSPGFLIYAKKEVINEKEPYQIEGYLNSKIFFYHIFYMNETKELPVGIGISEFHYYIFHTDCLTILNILNEKVVAIYDLRHMGLVLGMVFD